MGRKQKEVDHSVIAVERGVQRMIAQKWDIGEPTVSRYLNGLFSDRSVYFERIMQIREYARTISPGTHIYVVRDRNDGKCKAFRNKPRRDKICGFWFDPVERGCLSEVPKPVFPDEFLPDHIKLDFLDDPLKIIIKIIQ